MKRISNENEADFLLFSTKPLEASNLQPFSIFMYNELRNIYWTERELLIAIPIILRNGNTQALLDLLNLHINCTQKHIEHLETVFSTLNPFDVSREFNNQFENYKKAV